MSYRRALLGRWSARDRLAVLVIAVTLAFLIGTALLVVAAGDQTAAIAGDQASPGVVERYDSVGAAGNAAPEGAAVVPIAAASDPTGPERLVVARTAAGQRLENETELRLYGQNRGTTLGTLDAGRKIELTGSQATKTVRVEPRGETVFSPAWYVAPAETVEALGVTGALVIDPAGEPAPTSGVPLQGTLAFFLLGTRQTLQLLSVATVGAGLLIGVTVYSVTRMTIRDRRAAIKVIRATGARPRALLAVFVARGALLAGVGVAVGYAVGVILPNAAVNLAVYLGFPTSLAAEVTPTVALIAASVGAGTVALGAVAGAVAAWPAVHRPVAALDEETGVRTRDRHWLWPRLLDPATLVPTTATVTAFVIFAVLVAGMAGAIAPLATTDGATVTDPDAVHPIASDVPQAYAEALRSRGLEASPEILGFVAVDGRPFVVRGVNATAFAAVTDARLTEGRYPDADAEALVGADLGRTRDVSVGDRVFLGGSTEPALTAVEVVGVVAARGAFDDQLLVSLPTARHLAGRGTDRVQFIRTSGVPEREGGETSDGIQVVGVTAPARAVANGTIEVAVRVANDGLSRERRTVEVSFAGQTRTRRVALRSGARSTLSVSFPTGPPGTETLTVGDTTRRVEVVSPTAIELDGLPAQAPPDSRPLVRVTRLSGEPVANATLAVGDESVRTDADGVAAVPLGGPGETVVTARAGEHSASASVEVVEGVPREPVVDARIEPASPDLLTRPTAVVALRNPWNETLSWAVNVAAGNTSDGRTVTLAAGERTSVRTDLPRQPPGSYAVEVRIDGRAVATTTYEVTGDDRIASAIATGATRGQSGLGQSARVAFGNVELLLAVVVVLAGLMSVGGTTVTFARAVQGRRRTIGIQRATGASPERILGLVLADAVRIGVPATLLALAAGVATLAVFETVGLLSPFGVRLSPVPTPAVGIGIALGALGVALLGAALATVAFLRETPAALLVDDRGDRTAGD